MNAHPAARTRNGRTPMADKRGVPACPPLAERP